MPTRIIVNFPFEISGKTFDQLSEQETGFFIEDQDFVLPKNHALQIILLDKESFKRVNSIARSRLWDTSKHDFRSFPHKQKILLYDKWDSNSGIQEVRQWLYGLNIPFKQNIFLWYSDQIILTTWKILVRYWDAFAWSVGVEMFAFDSSMNWVCEFHHEDVITYCSN